jgi:hypothetical protein
MAPIPCLLKRRPHSVSVSARYYNSPPCTLGCKVLDFGHRAISGKTCVRRSESRTLCFASRSRLKLSPAGWNFKPTPGVDQRPCTWTTRPVLSDTESRASTSSRHSAAYHLTPAGPPSTERVHHKIRIMVLFSHRTLTKAGTGVRAVPVCGDIGFRRVVSQALSRNRRVSHNATGAVKQPDNKMRTIRRNSTKPAEAELKKIAHAHASTYVTQHSGTEASAISKRVFGTIPQARTVRTTLCPEAAVQFVANKF